MYTLVQSRRIRGDSGEPLPAVFKALEDMETRLIRGQLVLVAAGPGTGKSGFILTWALLSKVPTLYFSADSDAFTQLTRSISIVKGWSLAQSAELVLANDIHTVEEELATYPVRMNYDSSPTQDRIEEALGAYFEVYEDFPSLIVVDNITNVETGGDSDDPFGGLESLMNYLHDMARWTQACVVGLHHVTGPYNDANKPIPLSGLKGQIGRVPEMVLTLHKQQDDLLDMERLCVSTVKNRVGKADPSGETFAQLEFIGHSMTIRDLPDGLDKVQHPAVNVWGEEN